MTQTLDNLRNLADAEHSAYGVDNRTEAEVSAAVNATADRIEVKDRAGLLNALTWHYDSDCGVILDPNGDVVISAHNPYKADFYRRITHDHNLALAASCLIAELDHTGQYAGMEPRTWEMFKAAREVWLADR